MLLETSALPQLWRTMNQNKKASAASSTVEPFRNPKDIIAIKKLLGDNPRDMLLFIMGINSWLPISSLLGLKIKDIANVNPGDSIPVKGGDGDVLYINKTIHKVIQDYIRYLMKSSDINEQDFLFSSRKGGKPLTVGTVNGMVKRWAQDAGVKGVFGAQSLRKTCGYHHWIDPEADHECISHTFGHSSASLTKRFLCISKGDLAGKTKKVVVELDGDAPFFRKTAGVNGGSEVAWIAIMNLISSHNSEMIRLTDKNGINIYSSPSHFEHIGYTPEERIGKFGLDIVHPDDIDTMMVYLHELGKNPHNHQAVLTYRVRHADGHYVWMETVFTYIQDSDGSVKNFFQSARLVPTQKHATGKLIAKSKHQYFPPREVMGYTAKSKEPKKISSEVADNMVPGEKTDMIRIVDTQGINIYVSPSHFEATGYTPEEHMGKNVLESIHPNDIAVIMATMNEAMREPPNGKNVLTVNRIRHKNGAWIWVETLSEYVREPDGSSKNVMQFTRIVPERKQAEARLVNTKMQHIVRVIHEVIEWDKEKRLKILNIQTCQKSERMTI